MGKSICITYQKMKMHMSFEYLFLFALYVLNVFNVFVRCVEDMFCFFFVCVCVFVFDMYCMSSNFSSKFVLWNLSWTKWLIESKELLCGILHPSTTTKSIVVANSPCQPPWLTWNFWMSTLWQLVEFYVSMPCSKNCANMSKFTSTNMAPTWHLSRSWILTWVRWHALTWNPCFLNYFFCPTLVFGRVYTGWKKYHTRAIPTEDASYNGHIGQRCFSRQNMWPWPMCIPSQGCPTIAPSAVTGPCPWWRFQCASTALSSHVLSTASPINLINISGWYPLVIWHCYGASPFS